MKQIKKLCSYALFVVMFIIFTASSQICMGQDEEDTIFNYRGGFTKNMGQMLDNDGHEATDPLYYSEGGIFLLEDKISYVFKQAVDSSDEDTLYKVNLILAENGNVVEFRENNQIYYKNFYLAHTGTNGIAEVPVYESIDYGHIYEDIEINASISNGLMLKYSIYSGANPYELSFYFDGADSTVLREDHKALSMYCPLGEIIYDSLYAYQVIDEEEVPVEIAFRLEDDHVYFEVGSYHDDYALTIIIGTLPVHRPILKVYWSTLVAGETAIDGANDIWLDADNYVYMAGSAESAAGLPFPAVISFSQTNQGAPDAILWKFKPDRSIAWGTFFGGTSWDYGLQVAVNSSDYIYLTGSTWSDDIPACTTCDADAAYLLDDKLDDGSGTAAGIDIFIAKFGADGTCIPTSPTYPDVFRTYFGGTGSEWARAMTIDGDDNVYIGGEVNYSSFTTFPEINLSGAYNQTFGDFAPDGDLNDAFILRISPDATPDDVKWCTAVGGLNTGPAETVTALATDSYNNLFASGTTASVGIYFIPEGPIANNTGTISNGFPIADPDLVLTTEYVVDNAQDWDAFVIKFDFQNNGGKIIWGTEFGGNERENTLTENLPNTNDQLMCSGLAINKDGQIFITGNTKSYGYSTTNFPQQSSGTGTSKYNQPYFNNDPNVTCTGVTDAFIAMFEADYSLGWSTYFGGCENEAGVAIASDLYEGNTYITGYTSSSTLFPTKSLNNSYLQSTLKGTTDAFILKFFGTDYIYGMRLGGSDPISPVTIPNEGGKSIVTDAYGANVIFCGFSDPWQGQNSSDFPYADPTPVAYNWSIANGVFTAEPRSKSYIVQMKNLYDIPDRVAGENSTLNFSNQQNEYIQLAIYPNPSNDYIAVSHPFVNGIKYILIFNFLGQKVKTVYSGFDKIDISGQPAGLYLLHLTDAGGNIKSARIVIE